jgi:type IX secretion system substrate protein
MKKIIISLLFIYLSNNVFCQWQWAKQIGGPGDDYAYIGHVDLQSNIYIFGRYALPHGNTYNNCYIENDTLFGRQDCFIAKYDGNGTLLWVRNCVSPGSIGINAFTFDTINEVFYITGMYDFTCNIDTCQLTTIQHSAFLAKIDTAGNCIWAENVGANAVSSTAGTALTIDDNGYVYMAGITDWTVTIDTSTVTPGTFLAKFGSNGNNLWAKTKFSFTGFQSQMRFSSLRYYNNNIYAAGLAYASSISDTIRVDTVSITNIYGNCYGLLCMDAGNSTAKWLKFDGFPNNNHYGYAINLMDMDGNGNIYYTGSFSDSCFIQQDTLIANSGSNGFLSKYDANGNLAFIKQIYATNSIYSFGMSVNSEGFVFLSGALSGQGTFGALNITASTSQDLYIARYDGNGDCLGVDNAGTGTGLSVVADESNVYTTGIFPYGIPSGSINIAGNTFTNYGWQDIVFAKHNMITDIGEGRSADNNMLVIYANPNKGSFRLKLPDDFKNEKNLTLSIFDNSGKLIRQQSLNMNDEHPKLDIFGEGKGTYNVTLSNGKKAYNGKMIFE